MKNIMIYTNDDRDYSEIVQEWIYKFIHTMEDEVWEGTGRPGNDSGQAPNGVKIIFDGYGYNEETDTEDDLDTLSFAVFVHKDSLTEDFPPHVETPWALIHRPKEEVCIWCWYDKNNDEVTIIPFEDNNSTELDPQMVTKLIFDIKERDKE
jgi:hypothetical protein